MFVKIHPIDNIQLGIFKNFGRTWGLKESFKQLSSNGCNGCRNQNIGCLSDRSKKVEKWDENQNSPISQVCNPIKELIEKAIVKAVEQEV